MDARRFYAIESLASLSLLALAVAAPAVTGSDIRPEIRTSLSHDFKFSPSELADLEKGKVVTHRLDANAAGEIAAVGAVRINGPKEAFVARYRDIVQFKRSADVLEIGRFGDAPTIEDLATLTVDKRDLDLRGCRVGKCSVRLPAEAIVRFQREIDWNAPGAETRAGALFKQILLDDVRAYLSGRPGRIAEYDGEKRPIRPWDSFVGLLNNSPYVDEFVPGLAEHLKAFPSSRLPGTEDFLYWSKEKFGFTPFITVTHVTIAPVTPGTAVIASKDVYSSRYLDASLTLTIASDAVGGPAAFYLVYVNRSRASALTGLFAGLRRTMVERAEKSNINESLNIVKLRLEGSSQ